MMTPERFNLIQRTVMRCLLYCRQGERPLSALSRFIEDLRDDGWAQPDIRAVERTALARLTADSGEQFA